MKGLRFQEGEVMGCEVEGVSRMGEKRAGSGGYGRIGG
jgi:hypothetical protein